ncbi:MAG: hypothetical protein VYA84_18240 [Planctomycetota bacterium]|nr:hypothetical protein [Planctomycetota bacterium]
MDFWTNLFDNNYRQRADVEALKRQSKNRAAVDYRRIGDQQDRIDALEDQVGELALLCRSLLTLLREDGTVKPERLEEVMRRMDAADGVIDGKITPKSEPDEDPKKPPKIRTWPKNERIN